MQLLLSDHEGVTKNLTDAVSFTESTGDQLLPNTIGNIKNHISKQQLLLQRPKDVREFLQMETVVVHTSELLDSLKDMKVSRACDEKVTQYVIPSALDVDWSIDSNVVKQHGRSLFRWFNGSYKQAIKKLNAVCIQTPPHKYPARVSLLESMDKCLDLRRKIVAKAELGRAHFGVTWAGYSTDFEGSRETVTWIADHLKLFGSFEKMQLAIEILRCWKI